MASYQPIYKKEQEWVNTGTHEIKVFHPTMEEFRNFPKYIEKIESEHKANLASGICKIVPPEGWTPRPSRPGDYTDVDNYMIDQPVKETIESAGAPGVFTKLNKLFKKNMTVADFKKMAMSKEYQKPELSLVELERYYWRNLVRGEPVYGADTTGSLTEDSVEEFNMNKLGTILDLLKEKNVPLPQPNPDSECPNFVVLQIRIHGVNTVFLYFGMWKTTFPWHAEDMDLYSGSNHFGITLSSHAPHPFDVSVNYLHFGEPKFWYAIPPHAAEKFERLASQQFSSDGPLICKAFLRHKVYLMAPKVLRKNSIPFGKRLRQDSNASVGPSATSRRSGTMVQYPNEFIVTFPQGYHMGFNTGYNCAESTNFAIDRWIDFGKNCLLCYCRPDGVQIDMRLFMEKYRPDEYSSWYEYWYGERRTCIDDEKRGGVARKRKSSTPSQRSAPKKPRSPREVAFAERERQIKRAKKLVVQLWSSLPNNFNAEKDYNARMAGLYPHCALCQCFLPRRSWTNNAMQIGVAPLPLPESSRRYTTQQLFNKVKDITPRRNCEGESQCEDGLLQCCVCKVAVHEQCYSLGERSQEEGAEWKCERCSQPDDTIIASTSCVLCELRGGALLEAHESYYVKNSFIHCICAIVSPRAHFPEPARRSRPIFCAPACLDAPPDHEPKAGDEDESSKLFTEKVEEDMQEPCTSSAGASARTPRTGRPAAINKVESKMNRSKFECEICENQSENLVQCHTCVQNGEDGAALYHHITCASIAGMNYERRHHPTNVVCICSFHNSAVPDSDNVISLNDKVAVELEPDDGNGGDGPSDGEGRPLIVKRGRVVDIIEDLYCTVDFLDGSTSNDVYPGDIKKCEVSRFWPSWDGTMGTNTLVIIHFQCYRFGCEQGNHIAGSLVYVEWDDDLLYEGYYRGKAPCKKYKVELDSKPNDGEGAKRCVEVDHENVHSFAEPMPDDVMSALLKEELAE